MFYSNIVCLTSFCLLQCVFSQMVYFYLYICSCIFNYLYIYVCEVLVNVFIVFNVFIVQYDTLVFLH